MEKITIDYKPRSYQEDIHSSLDRFNVLVMHRRAGKTVLAINELIKQVITCSKPNPRGAYLAPYYSQAKRVAWDYVKQFGQDIPSARFNESELRADLINDSRIYLVGADNPDSLRGLYFDFVVMDEVAQMAPRVWGEIIRPALSDRKGGGIFIGTPKGKANTFYEFWKRAETMDGWNRELYTVEDTNVIPADELEAARREMSEDEFNQEFFCSWEAAVKGAFYGSELGEARRQNRIRRVPWEPQYPVHTSWDLGLADATSIWYCQAIRGELRIIDYDEFSMMAMIDIIDYVNNDKPYNYGYHFAPHDIKVREYTHGKSRISVARQAGLNFMVTKNLPIIDGIEAGKVMMRRAYIDAENCKDGLMALEQYRMDFDDKRQAFRKQPLHDWTSHAADSWRYLAINFDYIIRPTLGSQNKPKVIRQLVN